MLESRGESTRGACWQDSTGRVPCRNPVGWRTDPAERGQDSQNTRQSPSAPAPKTSDDNRICGPVEKALARKKNVGTMRLWTHPRTYAQRRQRMHLPLAVINESHSGDLQSWDERVWEQMQIGSTFEWAVRLMASS